MFALRSSRRKRQRKLGSRRCQAPQRPARFAVQSNRRTTLSGVGTEGKLKAQLTAVVYQEEYGKEYRPPTQAEINAAEVSEETLDAIADEIPHGMPDELLPKGDRSGAGRWFTVPLYGFKKWSDLFTARQLLALMIFVKWTRAARGEMEKVGYSAEWVEVVNGYLACAFDRMLDFNSTLVSWMSSVEAIGHTFVRYAFPITWDFSEGAISNEVRGGYQLCLDKVLSSMETISSAHTVKNSKLWNFMSIRDQSN